MSKGTPKINSTLQAQPATTSSIVVISDLHIGAGRLDDFDAQIEFELVKFLSVLERRLSPVELVINGDFLEFVQAEPWNESDLRGISPASNPLCFTEEQSLSKLKAIIQHHPNVFTALGRFLQRNKGHRLTLLPGNHDADLFWPRIRAELSNAIGIAAECSIEDRLQIILSQVYRPVLAPSVWIEHGHQRDRCNSFYIGSEDRWSIERPPYTLDQKGERRILECVGTRFLLKYLNKLDAAYPFVDNVKPFGKFIRMFCVSALLPGYGPLPAAVAAWNMMRFLATTMSSSPNDFLSDNSGSAPSPAALLSKIWMRMPEDKREEVSTALRKQGIKLTAPIDFLLASERSANNFLETLGDHLDIVAMFPEPDLMKLGTPATGKLKLVPGFFEDESENLIIAAREAIEHSGASAVVMGHTHEPQDHPHGTNYVNTGCWTRYLQTNKANDPASWTLLKRGAADKFPYRLLYAEINIANPETVLLKTWQSSDVS